jgi:Spy/CpxP family protein refolding chaperone
MKLWIKRTLAAALGATLVIGSLSACSGSRHGSKMTDADIAAKQTKMVEYAGKKLDLNDAQKQRLSVLGDKLREQRTALIGKTTDPRAELQSLVAGTTLDKAKAQAMVEEKTGALRSKSPEVIAAAADFYDSLNPAQQQQVRDLMQRRRGWGG